VLISLFSLFRRCSLYLAFISIGVALTPSDVGQVSGIITDPTGGKPIEFATVSVKQKEGGAVIRTGAADGKGHFLFEGLPMGGYQIAYGVIGRDQTSNASFSIDATHPTVDLGTLRLGSGDAVKQDVGGWVMMPVDHWEAIKRNLEKK
jgi:hypothetical protein